MIEQLPDILSVLRVRSTVLMPQAHLPIGMSQSSYADISREVFENNIIAVIQPLPEESYLEYGKTFRTGCAGKVQEVNFSDDDVTVVIQGVCRFEIESNLLIDRNGFERIRVSYDKYKEIDLQENRPEVDKTQLLKALGVYFKHLNIMPDWSELEKTPTDVLISALAIACPIHPSAKQSVLETVGTQEQSDIITKIIEMSAFDRFYIPTLLN